MTKFKAVIIDDEKNCCEVLEWLIQNHCPELHLSAICQSAEEGIAEIKKSAPDIIFLDIEMPKMNGFEMLESLMPIQFDVVFTTAYDSFAVRAFKYAALNYLLKPIDADDLRETVARLVRKKNVPEKEQMEVLFKHLIHSKPTIDRIALSTDDGLIFVHVKDIVYCKADSNYTFVYMDDGRKILVARTLKDIDETLSGKDFFRVHNSYLVNVNRISRFVRGDGGYIVMPDQTEITVSRSKRDEFFQLFAKF